MNRALGVVVALTFGVVAGCTHEEAPGGAAAASGPAGVTGPPAFGPRHEAAAQAVREIDAAMALVGLDATEYLPGRLEGVIRDLDELEASLARGEDEAVLEAAPALLERAQALPGETAAAKAAALRADPQARQAEWQELSRTLPLTLAAIDKRIDQLSRASQLPEGVTRQGLDSARALVAEARGLFDQAAAAERGGDSVLAVNLAAQAEGTMDEALGLIGMRGFN